MNKNRWKFTLTLMCIIAVTLMGAPDLYGADDSVSGATLAEADNWMAGGALEAGAAGALVKLGG